MMELVWSIGVTGIILCVGGEVYTMYYFMVHVILLGGSVKLLAVHLLATTTNVTTNNIKVPYKMLYLDSKSVTCPFRACNYSMCISVYRY